MILERRSPVAKRTIMIAHPEDASLSPSLSHSLRIEHLESFDPNSLALDFVEDRVTGSCPEGDTNLLR